MLDPLLQPLRNGTAGQPVETVPDETLSDGPADAAEGHPDTKEVNFPLMNLGSDDAALCTDGVCVL
ncbi:hypothetical protein ABZ725_07950 [Streptomyces sp. NPDC006872]|uniref:hypothetical protein n=1 Tax=Streptomyces sp. NPDC006872 TaxID=3155720 RepID=UPI0033D89C59